MTMQETSLSKLVQNMQVYEEMPVAIPNEVRRGAWIALATNLVGVPAWFLLIDPFPITILLVASSRWSTVNTTVNGGVTRDDAASQCRYATAGMAGINSGWSKCSLYWRCRCFRSGRSCGWHPAHLGLYGYFRCCVRRSSTG
mgnify:CR=1 FL=1